MSAKLDWTSASVPFLTTFRTPARSAIRWIASASLIVPWIVGRPGELGTLRTSTLGGRALLLGVGLVLDLCAAIRDETVGM